MLQKTRAIALHSIKYGDTSLIVHLYTEKFGRKSYMIKGAFSKKAAIKANMFFPLNLLELDVFQKNNQDLHKIKDLTNRPVLTSIPVSATKNAISIFIAELLYKTLREEEPNQNLFDFLHSAVQLLDLQNSAISNFHLAFMVQYSKYLGFLPDNNFDNDSKAFDLVNGQFVSYLPQYEHIIKDVDLNSFSQLLNLRFDKLEELHITNQLRVHFLEKLLQYYYLHISGLGQVKSLSILHEVFN